MSVVITFFKTVNYVATVTEKSENSQDYVGQRCQLTYGPDVFRLTGKLTNFQSQQRLLISNKAEFDSCITHQEN